MANQVELERVAKGLECCIAYDYKCNDCPYRDDGGAEDGCYSDKLKADALALLKEYEQHKTQKKSKRYNDMDWSGAQGNDGERIREQAARSEWGIYG